MSQGNQDILMKLLHWITSTILLWACMPFAAYAEEPMKPPLEIGARGAYSQVTFFRGGGVEGVTNLKYRSGFAFGISTQYWLHAKDFMQFGIQPELLFVRRGAEAEYEGLVVGVFQLSYLEVPVLGRVLFPLSGPVSPYIVAGPRLGLLLSAETTDANGNVRDSSDSTNTFDFGFSAGAGAVFQVSSRVMLSLEGRYDQSLMNRLDFEGEEVTNDQRHRAFFLMLGVSMGVGSPARTAAP
jgi:opacity protein-like surface antigen